VRTKRDRCGPRQAWSAQRTLRAFSTTEQRDQAFRKWKEWSAKKK
jgi:hypothetical protein